MALTKDSFSYIPTIGVVATAPMIARVLLGASSDKEGLFSYESIAKQLPPSSYQEGYFVGGDYMLMAHPYFRRGMYPDNNWAPRFIDLFWSLNSENLSKYIAIDEDRVRINVDDSAYLEEDIWYGAPFNKEISDISNGTIKLRPPLDLKPHHIEFFFANAYCLDIKWSEANGVKTFQALEIKSQDVQLTLGDRTYFPARYLHSEFDFSTGYFRHFDGAVQLFNEEEYLQRRDSDFNMPYKSLDQIKARSTKVFKLNGKLSVDTWVELCCHFFAANPLAFEYFTGAYPTHITNVIDKLRESSRK